MDRRKRGALAGVGVGLGLGIFLAPLMGPFALLLPSMASIIGGKIAEDTEPEPPERNRYYEPDIDEDDPIYHGINHRPQPINFLYEDTLRRLNESLNDAPHHMPIMPVIPYIPERRERQEHENTTMVSNQHSARHGNVSNGLPGARGTMNNEDFFRRHGR